MSLPSGEVWIEITFVLAFSFRSIQSLPSGEVWIEIPKVSNSVLQHLSLPSGEVWIEIITLKAYDYTVTSLPSGEVWIEIVISAIPLGADIVTSLRGSVD